MSKYNVTTMKTADLTVEQNNHSNMSSITGTTNETSVNLDDLLEKIYQHIALKYYHWIFLVLFFIVFCVGITGNFLVCYSVWRSQQLKSVTNFFLVNLAVADFFVILICLPASISEEMLQSWFLGLAMCKITIYLQYVSVFVSVLTLTSISAERYLAICHPLTYRGTSFKTRLAILIIWTISLGTPCLSLANMKLKHHSEIPPELRPWLTRCRAADENMEHIFQYVIIIVFYFCPLVVTSFAYVNIALCLWSSTSTGNAVSESLQTDTAAEQLRVRRRTAKMLIVVLITFAVCFLPIYILNILWYSKALASLNSPIMICLYWTARLLCYFNSAVNPVIYNFMSVKFRNQFKIACSGCYRVLSCCFKSDIQGQPSLYMRSYPSRTSHQRLTVAGNTFHSMSS